MRRVSTKKTDARTAWANRFAVRFRRGGGVRGVALVMRLPGNRFALAIEQRWLSPVLHFHPEFIWQMAGARVTNVSQTSGHPARLIEVAPMAYTHRTIARVGGPVPAPVTNPRTAGPIQRLFQNTRQDVATVIERRYAERRDSRSSMRTLERLVERTQRTEQRQKIERTMTLRRDRVTEIRQEIEKAARLNGAPPDQERRRTAAPVLGQEMPAVDLNQLADQVIRQIDRRVIARRERMGRS